MKTPDGAEVPSSSGIWSRRSAPPLAEGENRNPGDTMPVRKAWFDSGATGSATSSASPVNRVLLDRTAALADDVAVRRAEEDADKIRNFTLTPPELQ